MKSENALVDFKIGGENRGMFYSETSRCLIYLHQHESIEDIYMTIQHELIHFVLEKSGESDDMDEEQEEKLIFQMAWAGFAL